MDNQGNIGENIRKVRNKKGFSQQDLAEKCGFSNTTLSAYETGKKIPGLPTLAKIANRLGVNMEQLYYGDEETSFINTAPDEGRKIANAVYFLWKSGVISGKDSILLSSGYGQGAGSPGPYIKISNHYNPIARLLINLNEFESKESTYDDPNAYIEMLLSSIAKEINLEIETENNLKETGRPF